MTETGDGRVVPTIPYQTRSDTLADEPSDAEAALVETGAPEAAAKDSNRQSSSQAAAERRVAPRVAWRVQKEMVGGLQKSVVRATVADWVRNLVYLDGKPFSFEGREYLLPIYNERHPRKLLKYGRQSEKSTALANHLIVRSAVKPYNKSLYVAPSHSQARQFSASKLKPWIEDSPILSRYYLSTSVSQQVFERGMTNGSMIFLRSAFLNAERVRGITADELMLDEIQSFISSNIPVIMEVQSHSPDPQSIFAGTPLTNDNYIEQSWQGSSQCEWLVPCHRHTPIHWNFMDEKCIGKHGPICNKCGGAILPSQGKWFAFSSNRDVMGYHISQVMVPWMQSESKWKELLWKMEHYSKGAFYNEVLGISFDSAAKPISRGELQRLCKIDFPFRQKPDALTQTWACFAGVDWGEGSDGSERNFKGRLKNASYTVLTIGAYIQPKVFGIFFQKRYTGEDAMPRNCLRDIMYYCDLFGVRMLGSDWGFGWGVNDTLEERYGRQRVIKFQYVGIQRERSIYDQTGHKIQLNRTEVMTDFFDDLKKERYRFPKWEDSRKYLEDIEHIYAEYGGIHGLKYDHRASEPDDAAHSIIFCREAARVFYQEK